MTRNPGSADADKRPLRPAFNALPLSAGQPKCSAWGIWGQQDEMGTLNHLTPETVAHAACEVVCGLTVPLNLPLDTPTLPMNPARKALRHKMIQKGYANDDEIHLNTQASSHWDGPRHYPYQGDGKQKRVLFYNGLSQSDLCDEHGATSVIGIQNMAQRGIAGRGVLLDWSSYAIRNGIQYDPFSPHAIPLQQLQAVAVEQNVKFRAGDILLIRSGWTNAYHRLSPEERIALAKRPQRSFIGVEASEEMLRWHWDCQFAAVAGDTNAYEAWPSTKPFGVTCHEVFLSGWGMPIGELFDLEQLSETCRKLGRWSFFFTSSPLNLPGGKINRCVSLPC